MEKIQGRGMGRLRVAVVRQPHGREGCEGGALYLRDKRDPQGEHSLCKGPGARARSSVLKEYEGASYVGSQAFKTQVLTDEVREVRNQAG